MGLLSEGSPLSWKETKQWADTVRNQGILQFINLYHKLKNRQNDVLKWGDEVEYMIIKFDHERKIAQVSLRASDVLNYMHQKEKENPSEVRSLWHPEFGAYMVEATPSKPYGGLTSHFNIVEANMQARREEIKESLEAGESLMCLTSFPRLGCEDFTDPPTKPNPRKGALRSLFFPDEAVYGKHPRFKTLARNIRERRGKKVIINIPVYKDINTQTPFVEDLTILGDDGEGAGASLPDHIYMDAMGFGMGCCCLQVTFQACNIREARVLYDQLAPVCPIMMALSAASPVQRGYLSERDCRWDVVSASVDDRTNQELGIEPLVDDRFRINKSRYDTIDSYLSPEGEKFNDLDVVYDRDVYQQLQNAGIDHLLAQHVAHLFIRDPISLFSEKLHPNNEDTDHFENIQSTNWQSMRFKPPPPNSSIGWRVEFRPMEVQLTEFENAAFVVFVVLLTRVILSYQLNFLIPVSKVDENHKEAQKKDAVRNSTFWFRRDVMTCDSPPEAACMKCKDSDDSEYTKMTINEIINGRDNGFPGLVPLIKKFLSSVDVDVDTQCTIQQYLGLMQRRASGELMTTARWIREYIHNHPQYCRDSVVSQQINYDLLNTADKIQTGDLLCPELLGSFQSKTKDDIPNAVQKAENCYDHVNSGGQLEDCYTHSNCVGGES